MLSYVRLTTIAVVAVLATPVLSAAQGKVTRDPQTTVTPVVQTAKTDPRLAQKITYDSGSKRLHAVTDDLAKMTGVTILSGSSSKDWRVRDIPVVIYVKDMPLGKLLRAIADATHTRLAPEKTAKDPNTIYRIYRNYADEARIDDYFKAQREYNIADSQWQWDAMVAYGKSPELPGIQKSVWLVAKLIASLSAEHKARLSDGWTLAFTTRDAIAGDIVSELYKFVWANTKSPASNVGSDQLKEAPVPTQDSIDAAVLSLKRGTSGYTTLDLSPIGQTNWCDRLDYAYELRGEGLLFSARPKAPATPTAEQDMANPDLALIKTDSDWARSALTAKTDIEKPKDTKDATFADLIRAIASAGGLNIVTEDFASHLAPEYQLTDPAFKKQTTIADSLRSLNRAPNVRESYTGHTWFINDAEKLLIGWAQDQSGHNWRVCHKALVSEDYLVAMKDKFNGPGLDLDDAINIMCLGDSSSSGIFITNPFGAWFSLSRDFKGLPQIQHPADSAFWRLYSALEPSDKALAKSKTGLPLGKFDSNWISDFFRTQRLNLSVAAQRDAQTADECSLDERVTTDPEIIRTMVMHIEKAPAAGLDMRTLTPDTASSIKSPDDSRAVAVALGITSYNMVVSYTLAGTGRTTSVPGPLLGLPVRSPEREAEIIKAARGAAKPDHR